MKRTQFICDVCGDETDSPHVYDLPYGEGEHDGVMEHHACAKCRRAVQRALFLTAREVFPLGVGAQHKLKRRKVRGAR